MKDLLRPPVYEYEVGFSDQEVIKALVQNAVDHGRLPSGLMLVATFEIPKHGSGLILKANKLNDVKNT